MRNTNFTDSRTISRGGAMRTHLASILSAVVIALAMLAALVLPVVTRPSAALVLTSVAVGFAIAASVSLVHLAITDVRERLSVSRGRSRT